ncbi:MAG: histidine kinase N-terminal 7TM domain-containing protein [Candidatus Paceibacterota bacterium]|jgi:hypothetical protein
MLFLNPYSIPPLIVSILFLLLGSAIYFKNKKSKVNIAFALISIVTFWWQFSWFILFNTQDVFLASILVRFGYVGIIFIPVFFYHFFLEFLDKNKGLDRKFLFFIYGLSIFFEFFLLFTDFFIQGYYEYFWGVYPKAAWLHLVYLFFLALGSSRVVYLLFISWRKSREVDIVRSKQIKLLLIGFLIYFSAASDFLVNYGVEFYPVGFIFVLICMSFIAYAISKYHMFDVKIILTELFVGIISVASLAESLLFYDFWSKLFGFSVFIIFCFMGFLLIRYTTREVKAKEFFEQKVQERTKELALANKELQESNDELKRWYQLTIGREVRMAELKEKIKEMEGER